MKYTVILALPDYLAEEWCDTRTCLVQAEDPEGAIRQARMDVGNENDMDEEELGDLAVIAVYEGWLHNLIPEEEV